jgi:bacillithiol biosynthesis cysteine-adding enzyme BshC
LGFFAGPFDRLDTYRSVAESIDRGFGVDRRRALLPALRGRAAQDEARLQAFVEDGGYVVITGQQAGLLTGPLFTFYKALTAISLARSLEAQLGRPVLPVFWIASEDHDWEEASHAFLLNGANELVRIDAVPGEPPANRSVFRIPLAGPQSVVDPVSEVLIPNDFREPCLDLIGQAYADSGSLADGFEHLLDHFLGDRGLLMVRAEDPTLKALSVGVLRGSVEDGTDQGRHLQGRSAELEAAGFHDQVSIIEGGLQLFVEAEEGRTRLHLASEGVRVGRDGPVEPLAEVLASVEDHPERFSPGALLRPVVEGSVFPVLAYVAGPGEAAYYAQNSVLYDALGVTMPVIHPRAGARVIERKVDKVLQKYNLESDALAAPMHELLTQLAKDEIPDGVRDSLVAIRSAIGGGSAELLRGAGQIDPTLKGPIGQARNQSLQAFQEAEKKILQAIKRKNEVVETQLVKARVNLFPGGDPQERVLNVFHFVSRYGPGVIDHFAEAIEAALAKPS